MEDRNQPNTRQLPKWVRAPRTRRILKWVLVILISLAMVYPVFIGLMLFLYTVQYYLVVPLLFLSQLFRLEDWIVLFSIACLLLTGLIAVKRRRGKQPEDVVSEQPAAPDDISGE